MYSRIIADLFTTAEGVETRSISADISGLTVHDYLLCDVLCVQTPVRPRTNGSWWISYHRELSMILSTSF